MNHAIICLSEELRALQDARRAMLLSGNTLGPTDALLSQTLCEIRQVKEALNLLRVEKAFRAAKEAA